jgi:hypothetical protein
MRRHIFLVLLFFITSLSAYASGPTLTVEDLRKEYEEERREDVKRLIDTFHFLSEVAYSEEGSPSDAEYIDIVLEHIKSEMLDSESARFRNLEIRGEDDAKYVCGEVNGKNRFGGYTGFQGFIANAASVHSLAEPQGENVFTADLTEAYRELCR